jgi:hypothetical protein
MSDISSKNSIKNLNCCRIKIHTCLIRSRDTDFLICCKPPKFQLRISYKVYIGHIENIAINLWFPYPHWVQLCTSVKYATGSNSKVSLTVQYWSYKWSGLLKFVLFSVEMRNFSTGIVTYFSEKPLFLLLFTNFVLFMCSFATIQLWVFF